MSMYIEISKMTLNHPINASKAFSELHDLAPDARSLDEAGRLIGGDVVTAILDRHTHDQCGSGEARVWRDEKSKEVTVETVTNYVFPYDSYTDNTTWEAPEGATTESLVAEVERRLWSEPYRWVAVTEWTPAQEDAPPGTLTARIVCRHAEYGDGHGWRLTGETRDGESLDGPPPELVASLRERCAAD